MHNYQHSQSFDSLKGIKESIQTNYTSLQYLQTLDAFLWKALEPIAHACPSLFNNYLAKVVSRQTLKASAKLTSDDRTKLPVYLFNTLTAPTAEKAIENAKLLYINRGILFGLISFFRNRLHEYKLVQQGTTKMPSVLRNTLVHRTEQELGVIRGVDLYATLVEVEYWDEKARGFKAMIMEKYTRLTVLQAQSTYKALGHVVPLDDVVQIYMTTLERAINRCDSRLGVLTTFIQSWFKSAKSACADQAKHSQDQSYEALTEAHGDAVHTVLGVTLPDLEFELQQHVAYVSKTIDPNGIIRTALGISEFVTNSDKQVLLRLAV